jgi:predicted aspartyl protease
MILLATGSRKAVDPSDAKEIPWKHGRGTKKAITRNVVVFSAVHHGRSKGDRGRASDLVATGIGSSWL